MPDPIPEGYIPLTEAWTVYAREWPGKAPERLVEPFANAELHAFVRLPLSDQNYRLLPSSWRDQFFSDRVFLADTIVHTGDSPWSQFSGRTPFVKEVEFRHWLTERRRAETGDDPTHDAVSYPRKQSEDTTSGAHMFLGQAIEWIIGRGQPTDSGHIAERWDAAARELFGFLDAENIKVEGYRSDGAPRVYETLPAGIWAKMNEGDGAGLMFTPLDDAEQREDGGTVCVGDRRWSGARLATNIVLERWPAAGAAPQASRQLGDLEPTQTASRAPASRPASDATIKRLIASCHAFAHERGFVAPSRSELVSIIQRIYQGTSRAKIRRVFKDHEIIALLPQRSGPQGARNPNRNNELEEFGGFLLTAKLQN